MPRVHIRSRVTVCRWRCVVMTLAWQAIAIHAAGAQPAPTDSAPRSGTDVPLTTALIVASAAGTQLLRTPDAWPRTPRGFGNRLLDQGGFYLAQTTLQRALFRAGGWRPDADPCGRGLRLGCATVRTLTVHDRGGARRANLPLLASVGAASLLSAAWRPERRDAGSAAAFAGARIGIVLGGYVAERALVDWWRGRR